LQISEIGSLNLFFIYNILFDISNIKLDIINIFCYFKLLPEMEV